MKRKLSKFSPTGPRMMFSESDPRVLRAKEALDDLDSRVVDRKCTTTYAIYHAFRLGVAFQARTTELYVFKSLAKSLLKHLHWAQTAGNE